MTQSYFKAIHRATASLMKKAEGLEETLKLICDVITSLPNYNQALIALYQTDSQIFRIFAYGGVSTKLGEQAEELTGISAIGTELRMSYEKNMAIQAAKQREILTSSNLWEFTRPVLSEKISLALSKLLNISTCVAIPMIVDDTLIGCMLITSLESVGYDDELKALRTFTGTAALAIQRIREDNVLRKSEEQYRSIFESFSDVYFRTDKNKHITLISPSIQTYGYNPKELIGMRASDYYYDKSGHNDFNKILKGSGIVHDYELKLRDKKGKLIYVSANIHIIYNRNGEPDGLEGVLRDISKRKQADLVLRESEEKFRSLAEQSPNMIFINKKGRVLYVNKKCEEIMGYTQEEYYSPDFDFLTLIAPESLDLIKANFKWHLKGEEVSPSESILITKGGEKIVTLLTTKLITYEGESAILGTILDITEHKRAQAALKASEERYRMLIELIPEAIMIQSQDRIIFINTAGVKLFGAEEPERMIGKSVWDFIGSEYHQVFREQYRQMRINGSVAPGVELKIIHPGGTYVYAEVTTLPFTYQDKPAILAIFQDITDRKKAKEELAQRLRELELLNEITSAVTESLDLDKRLNIILDKALEIVVATVGMIFLADKVQQKLSLAIDRGLSADFVKEYKQRKISFGEGLTGKIAVSGEPVFIEADSSNDPRNVRDIIEKENLNSYIGIPLQSKGEIIGVMNIATRPPDKLTKADLSVLTIIGNAVGIALENANLFEKVNLEQQKLEKIVDGIGGGLTLVDKDFKILWANKYITDSYGSLKYLLSKACYRIFFGYDEICDTCASRDSLKSGKIETVEKLIANGKRRWYQITSAPIKDNEGNVIQLLELIQDITERKLAEEAARIRFEELEKWEKLTVGRELKMIELKKKIKHLERLFGKS